MQRLNCGLVELKFAPDSGQDAATMTFTGYGAVFGNVDAYGDVIAKGAFAATLAEAKTSGLWPAMLSQHGGFGLGADDMTPVGVWTEMKEDDHGLYVEGKLAETPRGRELHTLMKMTPRPAINGMSIGYRAIEWSNRSKPEDPRRTLTKVQLVELSLVTFPANGKARVTGVKSESGDLDIRAIEEALRDAGCSRKEAKAILSGGFKSLRDAEDGNDELAAIVRKNIATLKA
jgi:HK97 family phage prohead protease